MIAEEDEKPRICLKHKRRLSSAYFRTNVRQQLQLLQLIGKDVDVL